MQVQFAYDDQTSLGLGTFGDLSTLVCCAGLLENDLNSKFECSLLRENCVDRKPSAVSADH